MPAAEADVLVVGSGAAGLTAALTAHERGLRPLVIEKSRLLGGSSFLSGGGIWVPANHLMLAAGLRDSAQDGLTYLESTVGDAGPATSTARKRAFIDTAPEMVRLLERQGVQFRRTAGYPDYYPDRPGASTAGRAIEGVVFDRTRLGDWNDRLPRHRGRRALPLGSLDAADFVRATRTLRGLRTFVRLTSLQLLGRMRGHQPAAGGGSLVGQLLLAATDRGIPIRAETSLADLSLDDGRVVGAWVKRDGERLELRAPAGVLLASGGFARNAEMRDRYQPHPIGAAWSSAGAGDTGDGIAAGIRAGAQVDLMDEAWWGPASVRPDGRPVFHVFERSLPGAVIVDASGERFVNEAASYIDVVHAMYARNAQAAAIPAWMVFDARYRRRYPFGLLPPAITPRELVDSGYIRRASSVRELAEHCGIAADGLERTLRHFNAHAARGEDPDFRRGESVYDRYYGDPRVRPNPCLAPVAKPPFYAVALYPGDLGTKGGLLTDEHARVLNVDGEAIDGLYAAGNCTASVMGRTYPGPGASLAAAMAFAYRAVDHVASSEGASA